MFTPFRWLSTAQWVPDHSTNTHFKQKVFFYPHSLLMQQRKTFSCSHLARKTWRMSVTISASLFPLTLCHSSCSSIHTQLCSHYLESSLFSCVLCLLILLMFSALSKCGNLLRSWLSFIILVNISLKVLPSKSRPCTLPGRHNRASLVSPGMSEPAPKL